MIYQTRRKLKSAYKLFGAFGMDGFPSGEDGMTEVRGCDWLDVKIDEKG